MKMLFSFGKKMLVYHKSCFHLQHTLQRNVYVSIHHDSRVVTISAAIIRPVDKPRSVSCSSCHPSTGLLSMARLIIRLLPNLFSVTVRVSQQKTGVVKLIFTVARPPYYVLLSGIKQITRCPTTNSVRNKASPSDNDCLKWLRSDCIENLSNNCLTMNFVKDFLFANKISQMVENKCFVWPAMVCFRVATLRFRLNSLCSRPISLCFSVHK